MNRSVFVTCLLLATTVTLFCTAGSVLAAGGVMASPGPATVQPAALSTATPPPPTPEPVENVPYHPIKVPVFDPHKETEAFPGGPVMVSLPLAVFAMGSSDYSDEKDSKGGPHLVTIAKKLAMGQTEVTVAQYMACVNDAQFCDAPKVAQGVGDFPVVGVTWHQARRYAEWVTKKVGLQANDKARFRLPSEAEWEYAASAGGKTKWSGTNKESELSAYANNGNRLEAVKQRKV